jgi:hypothetical protein
MNGEEGGATAGGTSWRINEVSTDLVVTEAVGSLRPEEVTRIVAIVLEHLRQEQRRAAQHERDTAIYDRAYQSDVG